MLVALLNIFGKIFSTFRYLSVLWLTNGDTISFFFVIKKMFSLLCWTSLKETNCWKLQTALYLNDFYNTLKFIRLSKTLALSASYRVKNRNSIQSEPSFPCNDQFKHVGRLDAPCYSIESHILSWLHSNKQYTKSAAHLESEVFLTSARDVPVSVVAPVSVTKLVPDLQGKRRAPHLSTRDSAAVRKKAVTQLLSKSNICQEKQKSVLGPCVRLLALYI